MRTGDEETVGFILQPDGVEGAQEDQETTGENIKEKGSYELNTKVKITCQINLLILI